MPKTKGHTKAEPQKGWLARQFSQRPLPAWIVLIAHALALGVLLLLYALPHHVLPRVEQGLGIQSDRSSVRVEAVATPEATPEAVAAAPAPADDAEAPSEPTPEPTPEPVGSFRGKFADKFTDGEVISTSKSYKSANINVTFRQEYIDELLSRVYLVDIYVADISCLRTAFAEDKFGRGNKEWITKLAKRKKSIATLNGDYYGSRGIGVVVRNGTLYRDVKNTRDVAVLYWDGRFETIPVDEFNAMEVMQNGAYQCWHFGPRLLDDNGHAMTEFNADYGIIKRQPRSAFGYFEPGHYCFVVVDGRHQESRGVKIVDLSALMERLGCVAAYNLDGGQTSLLAKADKLINRPSGGGKSSSDYIIVVDEIQR